MYIAILGEIKIPFGDWDMKMKSIPFSFVMIGYILITDYFLRKSKKKYGEFRYKPALLFGGIFYILGNTFLVILILAAIERGPN
jgi:uncharacterized membrane protein